jgi:hypothetical protein
MRAPFTDFDSVVLLFLKMYYLPFFYISVADNVSDIITGKIFIDK